MPTTFRGRDVISARDFSRADLEHIFQVAKKLKSKPQPKLLEGSLLGSCFFEPSTRTRLSFEAAMARLGGRVVGFADPSITSGKKGETLADTVNIVSQFVDIITIRHSLEGAARHAAEVVDVPVINAGDGSNEHPTQAMLDLFTMQETHRRLDGLHLALAGDLKYGRAIHSLVLACSLFNIRLYLVAPDAVQLPPALADELKHHNVKFSFHNSIEEVVGKVDILYLTRMQEERFSDRAEYEKLKHTFYLTPKMLQSVKPNFKILHVMPRVCEMDTSIDSSKYAYYFQQARNGMYVRQALLALVLGKIK